MAGLGGQINRANTPMKLLAEDFSNNVDKTRLKKLAMEIDQKKKSRILCLMALFDHQQQLLT